MKKLKDMKYTRAQISKLGVRPRLRKLDKFGHHVLFPSEKREIKEVVKNVLSDGDELWQYWRMIPFEDGYACGRRRAFEDWVKEEVVNMWWDIGLPEFDDTGNWSCRTGGWWPYLDKTYLDISWLRVGKAIINMDEIWTTLRQYLEEKVHGYRLCPGMKLYRVMREIFSLNDQMATTPRCGVCACTPLEIQKMSERVIELTAQARDLVMDCPTPTTRESDDREWYGYH